MRSEFGGDPAGSQRPDGATRHAGTPLPSAALSRNGQLRASDRARMLRLTGDETGATAIPSNMRPWLGQVDPQANAFLDEG